ncbi:MAG: NAD-dependent epimerase/dehydratase [Thermoleophilia bacterium]|nr:NAD-dependent epimerase/dehydratase [Thermoleophilia bacterium]
MRMHGMDPTTRTILVTGATGYVGGRLVPELLERGEHVRALARTPGKLEGRAFAGHPHLTVAEGDVLDRASLDRALDGVDVAYYLVHSMGAGADFAELDLRAARTFAEACRAAGVQRIIYLSALGSRDDELSHHLESRRQTGDALRSTTVPVTELRAAIVIGSGSASYEIIRDLVNHLPVMVAPRWLRSKCEPIAIRNVIDYLVGCLDEPRTTGQELDIGGGEILTYQQMIGLFAEALGTTRAIIPVPLLTPRLSSWWLHLVTSVDFSIAQPLIEGLRNDVVTEDHRIRDWIPIRLIGYREAVELAQARASQPERWSRWSDALAQPRRLMRAAGAHPGSGSARTYRDYREFDVDVPADDLFRSVSQLGGDNGYGGGVDFLWQIRGAVDRAVGGPGLRRGRPRGRLHDGDPLDFWRVEHIDEDARRLILAAEMLTPGVARLEFRVEPLGDGRARLHQLATLTGNSMRTAAYWYAVLPVHGLVFQALGRHVVAGATPATR